MHDVDGRTETYASCRTPTALGRRVPPPRRASRATRRHDAPELVRGLRGVARAVAGSAPSRCRSTTMYRGDMLRYLVEDSRAEVLVIAQRFLDRLAAVAGELDAAARRRRARRDRRATTCPSCRSRRHRRRVLRRRRSPPTTCRAPTTTDIAALIYTSGTTGPVEGRARAVGRALRVRPTTARRHRRCPASGYYTVYPAFHVSGKSALYMSPRYRGPIVHAGDVQPHASSGTTSAAYDIKAAGLVGPMAPLLMLAPEPARRRRHAARERVHGAAHPAGRGVQGAVRRAGRHRLRHDRDRRAARRPTASTSPTTTSCGRVRAGPPHYEVRIVDEHDERGGRRRGRRARRARGGAVGASTPGYFTACPSATAEAWRNGWFHTGDAFRVRRGRQLLLRRPHQGRHPPAGREHLVVRGRGARRTSTPTCASARRSRCPSELRRGRGQGAASSLRRRRHASTPPSSSSSSMPRMPKFMVPRYVEVVDALPEDRRHLPHPQGRAARQRRSTPPPGTARPLD